MAEKYKSTLALAAYPTLLSVLHVGGGGLGPYYSKTFHQLPAALLYEKFKVPLPPGLRLELGLGLEPRYVWVNFEMDMISIGQSIFVYFAPYY
ncbi:hypothetical protein QBC32DRAFT_319355 [Pseudoneurospora amorphoporcata]|uniref:Uncharacterized protein n=1 Tax=Pseudoneurospora amorphoporcata TaxID=241081 RepID=A0AAN6NLH8_9PEZI|nr:hypothetical protein QBC32DRAFT_319355 [Pseudoneurospora amorphoporcata]